MAKSTAFQLVNKVLNNLGESLVSTGNFASISGLSLFVFNVLNEELYNLANEFKYKPLEKAGTITIVQNTETYAKPTDLADVDEKSFRYDNSKEITYITPQQLDRDHPDQTSTGGVTKITDFAGNFVLYKKPDANANSKVINYRYWQIPTLLSTATETGTCWIPEGFDLTLLADLVTYKVLQYKQNAEAPVYYTKVWGDGRENEGNMTKFQTKWGSDLLAGNIMEEPFENRSQTRFSQEPITG